jgi:hypothetical protein
MLSGIRASAIVLGLSEADFRLFFLDNSDGHVGSPSLIASMMAR